MRIFLAAVFIANVSCVIWLQILPRDSIVAEHMLAEKHEEDLGALVLQVETGRQYVNKFKKHLFANTIASWLLGINAGLCFCFVVGLTVKNRMKVSNASQNHAASDCIPGNASSNAL